MTTRTRPQVLVVDDEADIRELIQLTLGRMDLETRSAENLADAYHLLAEFRFDLCLTDMCLPDGDGIELVKYIQSKHPDLPVAMVTAHGKVETAVAALKAGAFDFIAKPVDIADLRSVVKSALSMGESPSATPGSSARQLLGNSPAILRVRALIEKLARSQAPVYIHGESGTGKELVAHMIHELGPRGSKPFVAVNCGAIPEALMESEFFGHKRGSFTGAIMDKEGLIRSAHGGTLFLDEVGDLPLHMQVKLLRAIQEKTVRPVGGQTEIKVDVRILSATHRDLHALVREGRFREDLYYRLNVIELPIPNLRGRPEDIPLLAEHLCDKLTAGLPPPQPKLTPQALEALKGYGFPGNVRELENVLERALTLCNGRALHVEDLNLPTDIRRYRDEAISGASSSGLPESETPGLGMPGASVQGPGLQGEESLEEYLARVEESAIREALVQTRNNKTAAAKLLGITFRALRYKLDKLGIEKAA